MVGRNWNEDWSDIVRNVIFKDDELKRLMLVPEGTKVMDFVEKYFIKAGYATSPLTNESVRVVYNTYRSSDTNNPYVTRNEIAFNVYVKLTKLHGADRDGLILRTNLIADRLNNMLTRKRLGSYKFRCCGETDMDTSVVGYTRYNITFEYKKTY